MSAAQSSNVLIRLIEGHMLLSLATGALLLYTIGAVAWLANTLLNRVKRDYLVWLKEAKQRSTTTIEQARHAIDRLEVYKSPPPRFEPRGKLSR